MAQKQIYTALEFRGLDGTWSYILGVPVDYTSRVENIHNLRFRPSTLGEEISVSEFRKKQGQGGITPDRLLSQRELPYSTTSRERRGIRMKPLVVKSGTVLPLQVSVERGEDSDVYTVGLYVDRQGKPHSLEGELGKNFLIPDWFQVREGDKLTIRPRSGGSCPFDLGNKGKFGPEDLDARTGFLKSLQGPQGKGEYKYNGATPQETGIFGFNMGADGVYLVPFTGEHPRIQRPVLDMKPGDETRFHLALQEADVELDILNR